MDGGKEDKERNMGKSIKEVDLSNPQQCPPSYKLLPEDYPNPMASQRSELDTQVLNDLCVSVTSGSVSVKHNYKIETTEMLIEEARFEMDMLLEHFRSATKCAEELCNIIDERKMNNKEAPISICIEDHLSASNLRCIERLYGDHRLDTIDMLHENPTKALPVILNRLKQKQEEISRFRSEFNLNPKDTIDLEHMSSLFN